MATVVLWGPPCSGKSTYIAERMRPVDLVVDFDLIAAALLPMAPPHHRPGYVRDLARTARNAVIDDVVVAAERHGLTAWVIDSGASPTGRAIWRRRGAEVVKLLPPLDVCLARAAADNRPADTESRIRAWFNTHSTEGS